MTFGDMPRSDVILNIIPSRQAVKEIAGRTVMTTAKFRGTDDSESTLDVAASQTTQYSMKQPESAVAQATGGSTAATETPMSSRIDPPTTDALGRDTVEVSIALSDDQSEVVEPSTKKETAGMELEFPSAKSDASSVEPDAIARAPSQPEAAPKIRPTMEPIVSILAVRKSPRRHKNNIEPPKTLYTLVNRCVRLAKCCTKCLQTAVCIETFDGTCQLCTQGAM